MAPKKPTAEPEAIKPEVEAPAAEAPKHENKPLQPQDYRIPTFEEYVAAGYEGPGYEKRFVNGVDTSVYSGLERPAMTAPFAPVGVSSMVKTVEQDPGEETVLMHFPRKVILTVDHSYNIHFNPGVQRVPKKHADHPWLKQNKVTRAE